ncbi:DNA/RNA polymerases superfamily protein [Cucumis melo var. makuwa]|uniref:DNA/RNA polymerases superfamily protein n=1 Tax=Cucumis melo var. makuwa TaxID=1194695 RepID=A0A5A7STG0_CUCMM|nr:DNA/RNA polymerases superfamily protein [Cucumis melo var. makuwa]
MGIKTEQLALRRNLKESCHHVLAEDASRIRTGCKVLPKEIRRPERAEPSDPEKAYEIERLKKLGATKETEGWWKSILARCSDARTLNWQTFRGIFEDKYYPSTYCEAKRDEFMRLKKGSLSMAEYERKYTELLWYANVSWHLRVMVSKSIKEEKSAVELSRGASAASGFRGHEQWRFTPGSQRIPSHSNRSTVRPQPGQESVASTVKRTPCTSATHSFVSSIFLTKLYRMLDPISEGLAIYTPVGDVLLVSEMLHNCEVLVEDCNRKEVVFRKPVFVVVVFRGMRKIITKSLNSVLKAEKLLRKVCIAFLAHVVEVQKEKLKPEDVPVMKEFLDVFLDNLSGLPSDREIEFNIELLPGITPISQPSYRMALSELKELKVKPVRQSLGGLLNPLPVQEWKSEYIAMDFLFGLPHTSSGHNGIWVIVDRLTKTARLLPNRPTSTLDQLARLYIDKIKAMRIGLKFSILFHPQTDAISLASVWHHMRPYMAYHVELLCAGRDKLKVEKNLTELVRPRTLPKTVTFPLLTLSVLHNNDAVVNVRRPHYDKDDGSIGRVPLHRVSKFTCEISYFQATLHSRQISIKESDVDRLHAVFRSKLVGSSGVVVTACNVSFIKTLDGRVWRALVTGYEPLMVTIDGVSVPKSEFD